MRSTNWVTAICMLVATAGRVHATVYPLSTADGQQTVTVDAGEFERIQARLAALEATVQSAPNTVLYRETSTT